MARVALGRWEQGGGGTGSGDGLGGRIGHCFAHSCLQMCVSDLQTTFGYSRACGMGREAWHSREPRQQAVPRPGFWSSVPFSSPELSVVRRALSGRARQGEGDRHSRGFRNRAPTGEVGGQQGSPPSGRSSWS